MLIGILQTASINVVTLQHHGGFAVSARPLHPACMVWKALHSNCQGRTARPTAARQGVRSSRGCSIADDCKCHRQCFAPGLSWSPHSEPAWQNVDFCIRHSMRRNVSSSDRERNEPASFTSVPCNAMRTGFSHRTVAQGIYALCSVKASRHAHVLHKPCPSLCRG